MITKFLSIKLSIKDIIVLEIMNQYQKICKIDGSILEIGVYRGKSAILFSTFLESNEELYLCDIFNQSTDKDNFEEISSSYKSYHIEQIVELFKQRLGYLPKILNSNSIYLPNLIPNIKFRMIHIDGSHLYSQVSSDLDYAINIALDDYGLVILDDYRSEHTIGVAAAIWDKIIQKKIVPILITPSKMYCVKNSYSFDLGILANLLHANNIEYEVNRAFDFEIIRIGKMQSDYDHLTKVQKVLPPFLYNMIIKSHFFKSLNKFLTFATSSINP